MEKDAPPDSAVAMLSPNKNQLRVHLSRWGGRKWMPLSDNAIQLDPWHLEARHHIRFGTPPSRIKAKARDTKLMDHVLRGDANGHLGLYAGGTSHTLATEIRDLESTPK